MYPKIYSAGQEVAILSNAFNSVAKQKLNGERTFTFSAHEKPLVSEFLTYNNQVLIGDYYDIRYIETSHTGAKLQYKVQCEHVFYRLADVVLENYAFTGTPSQILADLLNGTDFTVGTVEYTDSIIFVVNESATILNIILRLASLLSAEVDYSSEGFAVDLKNSIGSNNGFEIAVGKNLKGLKRVVDGRGELKTSYSIEYLNLDESEGYALKGLEKANVGDTVRVADSVAGVDVTNIVLTKQYDPIKEKVVKIELTNSIEDFTEEFNGFTTQTVNKGSKIYGVQLDSNSGLTIERTDKKAKSTFNADEWRAQTGDGIGGYTDSLYFDPGNGKYKFVGDVDVEGSIVVTGGSIGSEYIDATSLSAITANLGTITSGFISGVTAEFGGNGKVIITPSSNGAIEFEDNLDNKLASIESSSLFNQIDFAGEDGIEIRLSTVNADIDLNATLGDVDITASSGRVDIQRFGGGAYYGGSEIATENWVIGQGYGDITSVNDGTGLSGGGSSGSVTLSLDLNYTDDRYCVNESSNEMGFQEFGDDLEVFQNGTLTHTIAMTPV